MRKKVYFDVAPDRTKFRWERSATYYWAVSHLSEKAGNSRWPEVREVDIIEYENSKLNDWHSFIVRLNNPIISRDLKIIIQAGHFRIYPPFDLNITDERGASFDGVAIPAGASEVDSANPLPSHATRAARADVSMGDARALYAIRIDVKHGVEIDDIILFFLQICRQYSKQWWLSSPFNPFDTGVRVNFDLNKDFSPRDILRYHGADDLASTWRAVTGTTYLIGFETPIDEVIWSEVSKCMVLGYGIEDAVEFFFNGVAFYMMGEDRQCIMQLALMFEVAENKSRIIRDMNDVSKNKDLLKKPIIANDDDVHTFRKLITDRDNIAHGRAPYHLKNEPMIMLDYLEKSVDFVSRYLAACHAVGWDKTLKTSL